MAILPTSDASLETGAPGPLETPVDSFVANDSRRVAACSEGAKASPKAEFLKATAGADKGQMLDSEAAATLLRTFAFSEDKIRSILRVLGDEGGRSTSPSKHSRSLPSLSRKYEETESGPLTPKHRFNFAHRHVITLKSTSSTEEALSRRALYNREVGKLVHDGIERTPTC